MVHVLVKVPVVQQSPQRALRIVQFLAEPEEVVAEEVEFLDAGIDAFDDARAALAQRLGEALQVLHVPVQGSEGVADALDRRFGLLDHDGHLGDRLLDLGGVAGRR